MLEYIITCDIYGIYGNEVFHYIAIYTIFTFILKQYYRHEVYY